MIDERQYTRTFSRRLAEIMRQRGINGKELSRRVYVEESTISGYLRARRMAEWDIFIRIVNVLEVSSGYLLGETEDPSPHNAKETMEVYQLRETAMKLSIPEQSSLVELARNMEHLRRNASQKGE